jgi:hypothetical protein
MLLSHLSHAASSPTAILASLFHFQKAACHANPSYRRFNALPLPLLQGLCIKELAIRSM